MKTFSVPRKTESA